MNKILIFTNTYKPVLGGVQTVTSQIAEGNTKDNNIIIYTNKYPSNLKFYERIQNVSIFRFFLGNKYTAINSFKSFLIRLFAILVFPFTLSHLFLLFLKHKPKTVNIHFPMHQISYVGLLRKIFKFKLVISFHGHDVLQWEEKVKSKLYFDQVKCIGEAFEITACSNYLAKKVEEIYKLENNTVKTIYNGVDLSVFKKVKNIQNQGPFIFTFGRLEFHKGFDLCIEAFAKLKKEDLNLLIAGSGNQLEQLKELVCNLGLEKKVLFLGRITQKDIASYASKATLNVIPSRREPFGIVVLEALAANKILVASNVGGIPEVLDTRFGLLVAPTIEGIYLGMQKALTNFAVPQEKELSDYLESFSIDNMVANYEKVW